jgi:hypothetical protein
MEISKTLEEALESKNVGRIRSVFYTIAHEDPGFSTGKFRATLNFVKSKDISGLFDVYDGKAFKDESEWNNEYWADVASELMDNFCEERINHLQKVGRKLYPSQVKKKETQNRQNQEGSKQPIQLEHYQQKQEIGKLIGIGAVVIVVIVILLIVLL